MLHKTAVKPKITLKTLLLYNTNRNFTVSMSYVTSTEFQAPAHKLHASQSAVCWSWGRAPAFSGILLPVSVDISLGMPRALPSI